MVEKTKEKEVVKEEKNVVDRENREGTKEKEKEDLQGEAEAGVDRKNSEEKIGGKNEQKKDM